VTALRIVYINNIPNLAIVQHLWGYLHLVWSWRNGWKWLYYCASIRFWDRLKHKFLL